MKTNLLFQLLICTFVVCSSLYVNYRKQTDISQVLAIPGYVSEYSSNMTLSDLARCCFTR